MPKKTPEVVDTVYRVETFMRPGIGSILAYTPLDESRGPKVFKAEVRVTLPNGKYDDRLYVLEGATTLEEAFAELEPLRTKVQVEIMKQISKAIQDAAAAGIPGVKLERTVPPAPVPIGKGRGRKSKR